MTEMSPRHRRSTAGPQIVQNQHLVGAMLDGETAALLAELGLPPHFLDGVDIDMLADDSWDNVPDLEDDLEKGAKDSAFNFDWSWLQQDLKTPGQIGAINKPIIVRDDWRSPPAPLMVRPGLGETRFPLPTQQPTQPQIQPEPQQQPQFLTPVTIKETASSLPTTSLVVLPPPVVETRLPVFQAFHVDGLGVEELSVEDVLQAIVSYRVPVQPILPVIELTADDSAADMWSQPMSVATPLRTDSSALRKKQRQTRKFDQQAEQQLRQQTQREAIAQQKLARAEHAMMATIQRQERKLARVALFTQKKAYYLARARQFQESKMIQQDLPRITRIAGSVSAVGLLTAGGLWSISQIEWPAASSVSATPPRFQQAETMPAGLDQNVEKVVSVSNISTGVTPSPEMPSPEMTVAELPPPLPVDAVAVPEPTAPKPMAVQIMAEPVATIEKIPEKMVETIATNQPVVNAPVDEKPLPVEIQELRRNAMAGNRQAQHDLGAFYAAGRQIERDFVRAAYWFREAAMRGVPNAQYNLGVLLQRGLGVPQDTVMATQWYQSAARNNHPEAEYNLGVAYADGIGVEKSIANAAIWFEKAAVAGLPRAAFNLGVINELGLSGQSDIDRAVRWYARAAEAGERDARESLDRLNIAEGDIAVLASELTQDLANRYPVAAADQAQDQLLNSDQIAEVQGLLSKVGLYRGSADGQLGPKTVRAIAQFQEKLGLVASGKATESLLAALRRQTGTDNPIN